MAYDFTTDPFTQVYKSLWAILIANSTFALLVKSGNRIRFDGTSENPVKYEAQYADMDEVEIAPLDDTQYVHSSTHTLFTKLWEIRVASPSTRLDTYLHPLAWKIMEILRECADHNFAAKATAAGISFDMGYVKGCRIVGYTPANDDDELNRSTKQWTAKLIVETKLSIHRSELTG